MAFWNKERKFCCEIFESLTKVQDERGLSIGVSKNEQVKMFCLQVRGVDKCDVDLLQRYAEEAKAPSIKILIDTQQVIKYCPFCGTNLNRWIAKRPNILEEVARKALPESL